MTQKIDLFLAPLQHPVKRPHLQASVPNHGRCPKICLLRFSNRQRTTFTDHGRCPKDAKIFNQISGTSDKQSAAETGAVTKEVVTVATGLFANKTVDWN